MKCERCGHELDNDDLFCSHCGKAVFEEYMDEEDLKDFAGEKDRPEEKQPLEPDPEFEKEEPDRQKDDDEKEVSKDGYPSPDPKKTDRKEPKAWWAFWTILLVCLAGGVFWGSNAVKSMEKEREAYYTSLNMELPDGKTEDGKAETEVPAETGEVETGEAETEETETEKVEEPEKKQEYFKPVDPDSIDFGQQKQIDVVSTDQNSQNTSENYDYSADSVVDGDVDTSWQEGNEGVGEGTGIRLDFDGSHKVRYMLLYLGNWRSDEMWNANARPAVLKIQVGDSLTKEVEFSNEKKAFCLSFEEPAEASSVSFYIQKGYEGNEWNDNCISEIKIFE